MASIYGSVQKNPPHLLCNIYSIPFNRGGLRSYKACKRVFVLLPDSIKHPTALLCAQKGPELLDQGRSLLAQSVMAWTFSAARAVAGAEPALGVIDLYLPIKGDFVFKLMNIRWVRPTLSRLTTRRRRHLNEWRSWHPDTSCDNRLITPSKTKIQEFGPIYIGKD